MVLTCTDMFYVLKTCNRKWFARGIELENPILKQNVHIICNIVLQYKKFNKNQAWKETLMSRQQQNREAYDCQLFGNRK